jgi:transcriptional regulator with XRE-family HTH domain
MSEKIENSTAHLLNSLRNHVTALAEGGVIDPLNVRWKVAKADDRRAIAAKRAEEGISQADIAEELGVSEATISRDLAVSNGSNSPANETVKPEIQAVSSGEFETIIIDPPWPMAKIERDVRPNQAPFDYRTMSADELREFAATVKAMAAEDCHLFMWTTAKFFPLALALVVRGPSLLA